MNPSRVVTISSCNLTNRLLTGKRVFVALSHCLTDAPPTLLCRVVFEKEALVMAQPSTGRNFKLGGGGGSSRRGELIELYDAVVLDKPIRHSGRWGKIHGSQGGGPIAAGFFHDFAALPLTNC